MAQPIDSLLIDRIVARNTNIKTDGINIIINIPMDKFL